MTPLSERLSLTGAAGAIEVVRDAVAAQRGVALIAHPHPLYGGTLDNKVVQTLARACVQGGWTAVRFNFRGVGGSAGVHDEGRGELQDLLTVAEQLAPRSQGVRLALAGFSFGAFVASQALSILWPQDRVDHIVLVGAAVSHYAVAPLPDAAHARALLVHGEQDDTVPLSAVLDWARPQKLPVTVVPGCGHFFHGQLPLLKYLVLRHLQSLPALA